MKKKYMIPETVVIKIQTVGMVATSGGVETGGTPGNSYNSNDVSYGRGFWDFDEDEEE